MAHDFGENNRITKAAWIAKNKKSERRFEIIRKTGSNHPIGFRNDGGDLYLYSGTLKECEKILDNYVIRQERRRAARLFHKQEDIDDVFEGLHRDVKCPACGAEEELHCIRQSGNISQIDVHLSRVRLARESA